MHCGLFGAWYTFFFHACRISKTLVDTLWFHSRNAKVKSFNLQFEPMYWSKLQSEWMQVTLIGGVTPKFIGKVHYPSLWLISIKVWKSDPCWTKTTRASTDTQHFLIGFNQAPLTNHRAHRYPTSSYGGSHRHPLLIIGLTQIANTLGSHTLQKKKLTDAYKCKLPMLTFYSMEHLVLERDLADIDL